MTLGQFSPIRSTDQDFARTILTQMYICLPNMETNINYAYFNIIINNCHFLTCGIHQEEKIALVWLVGFYGISTFVGY